MRKFGIELECFHTTRDYYTSQRELPARINALGVPAIAASYTGRDYSKWQIKTDASIAPSRNANSNSGIEAVSRVLDGEAGIAECRKVADLLDAEGYKVNRSTGFHVHVDVSDLPMRTRIAIAARWSLHREEIKSFLPASRYDGTNHYTKFLDGADMQKVMGALSNPAAASWGHGERYAAVNLEHLRSGRVEFRQAAGTLNADKIEYWVRFLFEFIADTAEIMSTIPTTTAPTRRTVAAVTVRTGSSPSFRAGSRTSVLYRLLQNSPGNIVYASDVTRTLNWSRINFTDTVAALTAAGVTTRRVRRGVYQLVTTETTTENVSVPATTVVNFETILRQPFLTKLSPPVAQWVAARKSVFAEDVQS